VSPPVTTLLFLRVFDLATTEFSFSLGEFYSPRTLFLSVRVSPYHRGLPSPPLMRPSPLPFFKKHPHPRIPHLHSCDPFNFRKVSFWNKLEIQPTFVAPHSPLYGHGVNLGPQLHSSIFPLSLKCLLRPRPLPGAANLNFVVFPPPIPPSPFSVIHPSKNSRCSPFACLEGNWFSTFFSPPPPFFSFPPF